MLVADNGDGIHSDDDGQGSDHNGDSTLDVFSNDDDADVHSLDMNSSDAGSVYLDFGDEVRWKDILVEIKSII